MRDSALKGKRKDGSHYVLQIDDWHNLKTLSLKECQLVEIDLLNTMYGHNLEILNISHNYLTKIDLFPIQSCRNLISLDISNNELKTLDLNPLRSDQASPFYLKNLNISDNSISDLNLNSLVKCVNLENLNLSGNRFKKLDVSPLIFCKNLRNFVVDSTVKIEWRNTILDLDSLPDGLKNYSVEIEHAFEEYTKETKSFQKTEPLIEERLSRAIWLSNIEKQKKFDWVKIFSFSRPIYSEARNCYVYGCYRGVISIIFSLMESFLTKKLPFEVIQNERKFHKKSGTSKDNKNEDKHEVDPKNLNLSKLAILAKKRKFLSPQLYQRIYMYLPVRHKIIHYPDSPSPLGFYRTSVRGTGIGFRGEGFESPNRVPMLPLQLQEAAEKGICIFLDLLAEFKQ